MTVRRTYEYITAALKRLTVKQNIDITQIDTQLKIIINLQSGNPIGMAQPCFVPPSPLQLHKFAIA